MYQSFSNTQTQWRTILASLWIYFLLNIIFRDIHELFRTGFLEQALNGVVNGNTVTEENLLYGGLALQIPLLMTVVPRFSTDSMTRWSNIIGSTFMLFAIVTFTTNPDMDDVLFTVMEASALVAIAWFAWRGPSQSGQKISTDSLRAAETETRLQSLGSTSTHQR